MRPSAPWRQEPSRACPTGWTTPGPGSSATAVALLVTQLVFRTWAAWSSWYFLDDLVFLRRYAEARDWSYLVEP